MYKKKKSFTGNLHAIFYVKKSWNKLKIGIKDKLCVPKKSVY